MVEILSYIRQIKMIGIVFVAMFSGSLMAVALTFSGWPLWMAMASYVGCGLLGLVLCAIVEHVHPSLTNGIKLALAFVFRSSNSQKTKQELFQPRPVPALSVKPHAVNGKTCRRKLHSTKPITRISHRKSIGKYTDKLPFSNQNTSP